MAKKLHIMIVVVLVFSCFVSLGRSQAQSIPSCDIVFQTWPGDPVYPGERCTDVPFEFDQECWVGSNKCTAICWECLLNTPPAGGPINLANGNVFITQSDIVVPGLGGGLNLSRTWNSEWPFGEGVPTGMFGGNWRSTYEESIFVVGGLAKYVRGTGGIWTLGLTGLSWPASYVMIAPANGGLALSFDWTSGWTLTLKNGEKRVFDVATGHLLSAIDRNGNTTQLSYDSSNRLTTVTDPASHHLHFSYAIPTTNLVTSVTSDIGVSVTYSYDSLGRLVSVTKPDLTTVSFQYDNNSMISAVLDSNGKLLESHTYDYQKRGLTSSRSGGVDAMSVSYPPEGWLVAPQIGRK